MFSYQVIKGQCGDLTVSVFLLLGKRKVKFFQHIRYIGKLIHKRATVANINYHLVWSTKRRKRVLVPELAKDMQVWCAEAAARHGFKVRMIEIGHKDHVHALVTAPPGMPVSRILQFLKGYTSKKAFEKYLFLKKAYPGGRLWNPSSYIETIGCILEDVVRRYIGGQDYEGVTKWKGGADAKGKT